MPARLRSADEVIDAVAIHFAATTAIFGALIRALEANGALIEGQMVPLLSSLQDRMERDGAKDLASLVDDLRMALEDRATHPADH